MVGSILVHHEERFLVLLPFIRMLTGWSLLFEFALLFVLS